MNIHQHHNMINIVLFILLRKPTLIFLNHVNKVKRQNNLFIIFLQFILFQYLLLYITPSIKLY